MKRLLILLVAIVGIVLTTNAQTTVFFKVDTTLKMTNGIELSQAWYTCQIHIDKLATEGKLAFDTKAYKDTTAYASGYDHFSMLSAVNSRKIGGVDYKVLTPTQLANMSLLDGKYTLVVKELLAEALEVNVDKITVITYTKP